MNKDEYLKSIQKNDGNYKQQIVSPIRYPGGKSRAIGCITKCLPNNIKRIISPFCGGCSLEIAWANNLNIEVVASDYFLPLVNYWQVQLNDPHNLADFCSNLKISKEHFYEYKEKLRKWFNNEIKLSEIEAAALYFYHSSLSYGPKFMGWISPTNLANKDVLVIYNRRVERVDNFKCPNLSVELKEYKINLCKYVDDFVYLDPPYFLGKELVRQFYDKHDEFDHVDLKNILNDRTTDWILSYNSCEQIQQLYSEYYMQFPEWTYSFQQGMNNSRTKSKEILITNNKILFEQEIDELDELFKK